MRHAMPYYYYYYIYIYIYIYIKKNTNLVGDLPNNRLLMVSNAILDIRMGVLLTSAEGTVTCINGVSG